MTNRSLSVASSLLLAVLAGAAGCSSAAPKTMPKFYPELTGLVARDSAQFVAVIDTIAAKARHLDLVDDPGIVAESLGLSWLGEEARTLGPRLTSVRRGILVARGFPILLDTDTGECPSAFSATSYARLCPEETETRIEVTLAKPMGYSSSWGTPKLADDETAMEVSWITLGPSGYFMGSDDYVLKNIDGRWKVVRIVNLFVSP